MKVIGEIREILEVLILIEIKSLRINSSGKRRE